jgi:ketosteroid isomerase-like protein
MLLFDIEGDKSLLNKSRLQYMKAPISILTFVVLSIFITQACQKPDLREQAKKELMEVELDFAKHSISDGANSAFLNFIDDSCVLLRPNRKPVIGREKIAEMFRTPDTSFTLDWKPLFAEASESGDLGYTYGIYTIHMDSPEGNVVTKEGTYVTIWKKGKDGKWKFILDSGNQGIGNNNGENGNK